MEKVRVFYIECKLNPDNRTYGRVPKSKDYFGIGLEEARRELKAEVNIERNGMSDKDGNPFYEKYAEIWGVKEIGGDEL